MSSQDYSGQRFGQYELGELIGVGGMGSVYRAYQAGLRRTVAVKVLPLMRGDDYTKRFIREATTSAALEHAHIIPIYDFGTEKGVSYIVMRLLTGGSLDDRIETFLEAGKSLPSPREISGFLRQLASALDYAHAKGVIHRDIKPSNVMFDEQGAAYLVDFGIAKLSDATGGLTGTNMTVGTPQYMPPEQWRGEPVVPASDQYALAVMVYHLVTGRLPFDAPTPFALMHKHVYETPPTPNQIRTDLPPAISDVLNRALAKSPADRYPSVTAFAQAFEDAAQGMTSSATGIFAKPLPFTPSKTAAIRPSSPSKAASRRATLTRVAPVAAGGTVIVIAFISLGFLIAQVIFQPQPKPTTIAVVPGITAILVTDTSAPPTPTALPPTATDTSIPPTTTETPIPPTETPVPTIAPTIDLQAIVRGTLDAIETRNAVSTKLFVDAIENQTATARAWTPTQTTTPTVTIQPTNTPLSPTEAIAAVTATPLSTLPPPTLVLPTLVLPTLAPTQIALPSPATATLKPFPTSTPLVTATLEADAYIREVTADGTRMIVYQQPSLGATQLVTLFVGDRVRLTTKTYGSGSNQWLEVTLSDNRTGWVRAVAGTLKTTDPNATSPGFKIGTRVRITAAGASLNMRTLPSTTAPRLKILAQGTTLVIIGGPKRGGFHMWWQFTTSDGTQGWIIDIPEWFEIY